MAKDFLNVIERALIMGISDKINNVTGDGEDVYACVRTSVGTFVD